MNTKYPAFEPHFFFRNKHFNTLYRYLFSKEKIQYRRVRISTPDSDFIDLDFSTSNAQNIVIGVHGLEGSSASAYIQSLGIYARKKGYDFVAVNLRGCSGENNQKLYSYHSGKTEDIVTVLQFIRSAYSYENYYLVGYSLGANLVLKFMGEFATTHAQWIKACVGVSVPCDLKATALTLDAPKNWLYRKGFLMTLKRKALQKVKAFPQSGITIDSIKKIASLVSYDQYFTAPANGFASAFDYYKKSGCKQFLSKIQGPVLLITALDDPFFNEKCYPYAEASNNKQVSLLFPKYGGHVGFYEGFSKKKQNWLERVIFTFFDQNKVSDH